MKLGKRPVLEISVSNVSKKPRSPSMELEQDLPDELLLIVLQYLEWRDVLRLSEVSTRLRRLSDSEEIWLPVCRNLWHDKVNMPFSQPWIPKTCYWRIILSDKLLATTSEANLRMISGGASDWPRKFNKYREFTRSSCQLFPGSHWQRHNSFITRFGKLVLHIRSWMFCILLFNHATYKPTPGNSFLPRLVAKYTTCVLTRMAQLGLIFLPLEEDLISPTASEKSGDKPS